MSCIALNQNLCKTLGIFMYRSDFIIYCTVFQKFLKITSNILQFLYGLLGLNLVKKLNDPINTYFCV